MLNVSEIRGLMVDLEGTVLLELTERRRHRGREDGGRGVKSVSARQEERHRPDLSLTFALTDDTCTCHSSRSKVDFSERLQDPPKPDSPARVIWFSCERLLTLVLFPPGH